MKWIAKGHHVIVGAQDFAVGNKQDAAELVRLHNEEVNNSKTKMKQK
jgi:hypothetical protein